MQFGLMDEEEMIRDTARRIAADRPAPVAERSHLGGGPRRTPREPRELARNGFMTLNVESRYGGTEAGTVAFALAIEELGYACASTAVASVTNMVGEVIQAVGSAEHKEIHLPRLADGTYPAVPSASRRQARSDLSSMKTRARRDGDFVLDGSKIYITSADSPALHRLGRDGPERAEGQGDLALPGRARHAGLVVGLAEKKMGQHGSPTNAVHFDGCRVPASAQWAARTTDSGSRSANSRADRRRCPVSRHRPRGDGCGDDYAKSRQQFGGPIADFQGIQWMIADREVDLEAARLLILKAAYLKDRGSPSPRRPRWPLFASEAAHRATDTAIQLHGGAGYCSDFPSNATRATRITRIYEGTSEIQRLIIARETLRQVAQRMLRRDGRPGCRAPHRRERSGRARPRGGSMSTYRLEKVFAPNSVVLSGASPRESPGAISCRTCARGIPGSHPSREPEISGDRRHPVRQARRGRRRHARSRRGMDAAGPRCRGSSRRSAAKGSRRRSSLRPASATARAP